MGEDTVQEGNLYDLRQMRINESGQFEHADLFFTTKNGLQLFISLNHATVTFDLKVVRLDVFPDFFGYFGTR